ncbi:MAG: DUF4235 domain-containing protein [Pirellulaceae bacterium]|nr:DUF4235 domain-containing protein [Pirellulaceae bacterium]
MLDTIKESYQNVQDRIGDATGLTENPQPRNPGIGRTEAAIAFAAATATTLAMQQVLEATWRKSLGSEPPKNPASRAVTWKEALVWGALSGAVIGATRIASRRAASSAYRGS